MPFQREGTIAMQRTPLIRLLSALYAALALMACGSGPTSVPSIEDKAKAELAKFNSPVKSTITLGKVGVLSKTSAITLRRLILTAVSNATPADTVRDTSTVGGTEAQTVKRVLKLKPLVSWTLKARTFDQRDSVIHTGQSQAFSVNPADTAEVSLNLASRFVMYQAQFTNLPTSVSGGSAGRIGINLNRLVLRIDGAAKADSTAPGGLFSGGSNVILNFDYVTPGLHTVAMEAYGSINGWQGLLFSGTATFSSTAGQDGSQPVTLNWVGPNHAGAELTIILGRIGKVTVIGGFNPML